MRLQISSGQGPEECELAVSKFLHSIKKEFKDIVVVEKIKGKYKNTYKSVIIESSVDLSFLEGTIKWISESPYRKNHKRKNWFIHISVINAIKKYEIDEKDIRFETFRSSGNGGQNVNKVETGVRAIYEPMKITAEATEERNQMMNKKIAINKLKQKLKEINDEAINLNKIQRWQENIEIERGNEVRIYKGMSFARIDKE